MKFKLLIALVAFAPTLVLAQPGMPPAPTTPPSPMKSVGGEEQRKPITPSNPVTPTPTNNVGSKKSTDPTGTSVGIPSDQRLKRDIHQLATMPNGIQLYSFKYLWSDDFYVGVMAQDLLSNPQWKDAVITSNVGYYSVDYSKLGIQMTTLGQYQLQQQQSNVAVTN